MLFQISIDLLNLLGTYWIFFRGGEKFLALHPGLINFYPVGGKTEEINSSGLIKIIWTVVSLITMVLLLIIWFTNIRIG